MSPPSDEWSRWLLDRRDGGSDSQRAVTRNRLAKVRDRVLAPLEPLSGATLLDVGAGDGYIGLEALNRVGPNGRVIFSDVSEELIQGARVAVRTLEAEERAQFLVTDAEGLAQVETASVDAATTRSVLIYVDRKDRAFEALHRVLRPGGRLSLAEPVNRLMFPESDDRLWGYDVTDVRELAQKVKGSLDGSDRAAAAMLEFDDRDLVELAERTGFERVHLECHIDIEPGVSLMEAEDVETLLRMAPNPLSASLGEAVEEALSPAEAERFVAHLTEAIAARAAIRRTAIAFLVADKRPA